MIAETSTPIVKLLMVMLFVVCWPISKILDIVLGEHHDITRYKNDQLKALVKLHSRKALAKVNIQVQGGQGLS